MNDIDMEIILFELYKIWYYICRIIQNENVEKKFGFKIIKGNCLNEKNCICIYIYTYTYDILI